MDNNETQPRCNYPVSPSVSRPPQPSDSWAQKYWRPVVAFTYLLICLFDFVIMAMYVEKTSHDINYEELEKIMSITSPDARLEVLKKINLGNRVWEPLTIQGGAILHLAFGAIITGGAVTRGMEKTERERNNRP